MRSGARGVRREERRNHNPKSEHIIISVFVQQLIGNQQRILSKRKRVTVKKFK